MRFAPVSMLILLVVVPAFLANGPAEPKEQTKPRSAAKVSQGSARRIPSRADEKKSAAPCPRGAWKDDPVCFGENDPDILPTPKSASGKHMGANPGDVTITPQMSLNSRTAAPGVVYKHDGTALTSDVGSGVAVHLPF